MPAVRELSELLKGIPKGSWVAISRNEESVIAYAPTLEQVLEKAKEAGEDRPVVIRVPERDSVVFLPAQ